MFDQNYLQSLSVIERKRVLDDNSDKIQDGEYFKALTDEELRALRETFTEKAIELSKHKEELKKVQADFKAKIMPVENIMAGLLSSIRSRGNTIQWTLYYMANHDEGMMEVYNVDGELVESRRLRPDEKTQTIKFQTSKSA